MLNLAFGAAWDSKLGLLYSARTVRDRRPACQPQMSWTRSLGVKGSGQAKIIWHNGVLAVSPSLQWQVVQGRHGWLWYGGLGSGPKATAVWLSANRLSRSCFRVITLD